MPSPPAAAPANPPVAQAPLPPPAVPPTGELPAPVPSPLPPVVVGPGRATVAAFLAPLSGSAAPIGTALFNAAQLALFEVGDDQFTLLPLDTKGTAEGAAAAAQQAVAGHAEIVIGPLFSAETKAAGPVVRQAGINMVAFTADASAAGNGVYVLGFLPGPQAQRVVDFARSLGRSRLAILAPSNDYGRTVAEYLSNNVQTLGVGITGLEYYDPNATDLSGPLKRLIKVDPRQRSDPGFDVLMLPDEGARLRAAAAAIAQTGLDLQQTKLLGTMLWEDSQPGSEPALVGGWYPAPPDAGHADFDTRYARAFGSKPPRLASLGYDGAALAAVLARRSPHNYSTAMLTTPSGFAGVDGLFRLLADGTAERGYAIREVVANGPDKEVAAAPAAFQAAY
jgi:ABC-type branched-subunit amino acid transport system substrate-binding protein